MHPSLLATGGNDSAKRDVRLPILAGGEVEESDASSKQKIRFSKSGPRRAIILASIQGLIIAHIVLWLLSKKYGWFAGRTTTPVEPSESMEFVKNGMVNAGLIFFSIALLSTLVLGRWFCGWGCHIVMLQDFCGWIMKKCGVRPKAFRSRFLIYVPLLLALYMFVWPAAYRWGVLPMQSWLATKVNWVEAPGRVAPWGVHVELTTPDFWATFAGVAVAIPFLFICGFATVYFLGAKGFCTYGCPYGGFFAPLDKYAPGRIRVTDACEGCGHCTAVCTSNVRVHEEVREYGMVVDVGCMKCLDCISVCPNEALYFGFGKPAVMKGEAKNKTPQRKYDLTLGEEFLCASVFALTFFCTRPPLPLLMAVGLAGCVTFLAWKTWRILRDANVTFHRFQLKLGGRMRRAGWVLASLTLLTLAMVIDSGASKAAYARADWHDTRVEVAADEVFAGRFDQVRAAARRHAADALRWYGIASAIPSGGIGMNIWAQGGIDIRRAWLHCVLDQFDQAEAILRRAVARDESEATVAALAMFLRDRNDPGRAREALELYERTLQEHPEYAHLLSDFEEWAPSINQTSQVMAAHRARLLREPFNILSLRRLSLLLLHDGQYDEGLALTRRWIEADPRSAEAHRTRAAGLAAVGVEEQAIAEMRLAVQYSPPGDTINRDLLAQMLDALGRSQEAAAVRAEITDPRKH